jgi:hypothetical protein
MRACLVMIFLLLGGSGYSQFYANVDVLQEVQCPGGLDGKMVVHITGGTSPYTITWQHLVSNVVTTVGTGDTLRNCDAGIYLLTVKDAANQYADVPDQVTMPSPDAFDIQTGVQSGCTGANNGYGIVLVFAGGTSPYSFHWSNGFTGQYQSNLAPGNYIVDVSDARNCSAQATISIQPPPAMMVVSGTPLLPVNGCDGHVSLLVSGGRAPYSYLWSNGSSDSTLTGICGGIYSVTVRDAEGCIVVMSVNFNTTFAAMLAELQPIQCAASSTGSLVVHASGGVAPYHFQWFTQSGTDIAGSDSILTGKPAGSYYVVVHDAQNIVSTSNTVTLIDPPVLNVSVQAFNGCAGASNGTLAATANGGVAPYTYSWSNGATTQVTDHLGDGIYQVTVSDARNCTYNTSGTISPSPALTLSLTVQNDCGGSGVGSLLAVVSGGNAPYFYQWSNGATGVAASHLSGGTYSVVVTDVLGCTIAGSANILSVPVISLQLATTDASCFGGFSGSATAVVSGGTLPYSYIWSNSSINSPVLSGLGAGDYFLLVSDANGCGVAPRLFTIGQPASAVSAQLASTNVFPCFRNDNGAANVTASGGTEPYLYLWSNSQTTPAVTDLAAGSYFVIVYDAHQCQKQLSFTITQPDSLGIVTTGSTIACSGGLGTASVAASGGSVPYSYAWSNGATTAAISGLAAGTYTVVVKDVNQCSRTATATVGQASPLVLTISHTDISCNGNAEGNAIANVSGGTAPYSYQWNSGLNSAGIIFVPAGDYSVHVTDANGCVVNGLVSILQPPPLQVQIAVTGISCFGANDASATSVATGGTAPYNYNWSTGANTTSVTGVALFSNLYLTLTDAHGCTAFSNSNFILQPPLLEVQLSSTSVSCVGFSNGAIAATPAGGSAPYQYLWSTGATTSSISNLPAGSYSVTIKDAHQCQVTQSINVSQPSAAVSANVTTTAVSCFGGSNGSVTIVAQGGVGPYQYTWSNGSTAFQSSGLTAGGYTWAINDHNGCTLTGQAIITQPSPLFVQVNTTNVLCFGDATGSATAIPTGGTPPYQYLWSNGVVLGANAGLTTQILTITITDARGCTAPGTATISEPLQLVVGVTSTNVTCFGAANGTATAGASGGTAPYNYSWSVGAQTATVTGLAPGTHTVTVTDANNCSTTQSVTISQPAALVNTVSVVNPSCAGYSNGSATATATGGTAPYLFNWSTGAQTAAAPGLASGSYSVIIQDAQGCTVTSTIALTSPTPLTGLVTVMGQVSCFGGSDGAAGVVASGGTAPYQYIWSNGATTNAATGFTAGVDNVDITDARGCLGQASFTITQPALLQFVLTSTPVSCFGLSNGTIAAAVNGGTTPYQYSWSNGSNSNPLTALPSGQYTLTVTDAHGCTTLGTEAISQPLAPLTVTMAFTDVSLCFGFTNGSALAVANGGTAPFQYLWSNGATTDGITNVPAGSYNVLVTDAQGCTQSGATLIDQPRRLVADLGPDRTLCSGQSLSLDVTSNYVGSTYQWSSTNGFVSNSPIVTLSAIGSYYLLVSNSSGCVFRDTIVISRSTNNIYADFVVPSVVFKGIPVTLVNITSPAPDSIRWIIPNSPLITVNGSTQVYADLVFNDTGIFDIGITTMVGQCQQTMIKPITVLLPANPNTGAPDSSLSYPLIREFSISPNPNNGVFAARIVLKEVSTVRLRMISVTTGVVVDDRILSGFKQYAEPYTLNLPVGAYFILLEAQRETRVFKFIKN